MIIKEKVKQAVEILNEQDVDMWLIFCRESDITPDPALKLVVGNDVVGQSVFMISKTGATLAILSKLDAADFLRSGIYEEVITYDQDVESKLLQKLYQLNPRSIAINYSKSSVATDGLTHGMYLLLQDYLKETPYLEKLISADKIQFSVRGRKNRYEIEHLRKAAVIADDCWQNALAEISTGMSEIEIADVIGAHMKKLGISHSFETIVNAGAKTQPGHGSPTDAVLEQGDLLHVDMGVVVEGYCSDIQRLAYFKRDSETNVPNQLQKAFDKVRTIIDVTAREYKAGAVGWEIDALARQMLKEDGYAEYQHCLGHQIGRAVHDGAALVGPKWKRYGEAPCIPLETNNTFTAELGIELPNIGYVGLEEDLIVTETGGEFLGPRQTELIVK